MHDVTRLPLGCGNGSIDQVLEAWRDLGSYVASSRMAKAAGSGSEAGMPPAATIGRPPSYANENGGYM
jgi:hypothetical protein